jgi:hypothetical protein
MNKCSKRDKRLFMKKSPKKTEKGWHGEETRIGFLKSLRGIPGYVLHDIGERFLYVSDAWALLGLQYVRNF